MHDFKYVEETGEMLRRTRNGKIVPWFRSYNKVNPSGYYNLTVGGVCVGVHCAVWAYHNGAWANGDVDHINGIRTDNRIENLRILNRQQNLQNSIVHKYNTSGTRNVCFHKPSGRWRSVFVMGGKRMEKYHRTKNEAVEYVNTHVCDITNRSTLTKSRNDVEYGV